METLWVLVLEVVYVPARCNHPMHKTKTKRIICQLPFLNRRLWYTHPPVNVQFVQFHGLECIQKEVVSNLHSFVPESTRCQFMRRCQFMHFQLGSYA
jgi:hypothetical protein